MTNPLEIVIYLTIITERATDALITPIFDKFKLDKFYLKYIAWIIAGFLIYLSGANAFTEYFSNPIVGQVATAIIAGGGANILHDVTTK